jgi:16S rRNA (guanine966-N2)-methyltransferase
MKDAKGIILPVRSASTCHAVPPANQIRIIGGRWRGRCVRFPPREGVRPTPDRVRETLFNWLGQDLTGATTLDPFTGSGALSLEALSRGAALAVAIDRSAALVHALAATGAALGAAALEAHCADAHAFLARETRLFDVIFLDPPFDEAAWSALLPAAAARLAPGGALYAEARTPIVGTAGLAISRRDRAGQVHYHLLRHAFA